MSQPDASFETLLLHLKENRGFDFTGYKRTSLTRRVDRRMAQVGASDYSGYLEYLELHAEEFTALFNTILDQCDEFLPRCRGVGLPAYGGLAQDSRRQGAG